MYGSCDVSGEVIENRSRYGALSWKPNPCTTCTHWITQGCVLPPCPVQVTVPVGKCCPTCPGIQGTDSQAGATPIEADNITADIKDSGTGTELIAP